MSCQVRSSVTTMSQGFALLEVLIAILIFTVGVLGLIGVQASSIQASVESKNRAEATLIANQVIGDIWTRMGAGVDLSSFTGTYSSASHADDIWAKTVVAALPQGVLTVDANAPPEVQIRIAWQAPGDQFGHSYAFTTQVNLQ